MVLTTAMILGLLAAAGVGGTAAAGNIGLAANGNGKRTFADQKTWFNTRKSSDTTKANQIKAWLKEDGIDSGYIDSLSDSQLAALSEQYMNKKFDFGGFTSKKFDYDSFVSDLKEMNGAKYNVPEPPDYQSLYDEASKAIDTENESLNGMYDKLLTQQTGAYQNQMNQLGRSYGDYANQVLGNQYQQNAQLMGTVGNTLKASRQTALEAGASAGMRLAENVNTLMSVQNKQNTNALETSNNLAQQLLNQRQAAAGIQGNYQNALAQNTSNKANVLAGTSERKENYANTRFDTENDIYRNSKEYSDTTYDNAYGLNPQSDYYKSAQTKDYYSSH